MANLYSHHSQWKDPRWSLLWKISLQFAFYVFLSAAEPCWTSCIRQHVQQLVKMERWSFCLRKSRVCRTLMMPHGPRQAIAIPRSAINSGWFWRIHGKWWKCPPTSELISDGFFCCKWCSRSWHPSRWSSMCRVSCLRWRFVQDETDLAWETTYRYI